MIILDDHLVRDLAAGELSPTIAAGNDDLATTNLWLFRLIGALAREGLVGTLTRNVKQLGTDELARFRRELADQFELLTIVPMAEIVWSMAELQARHRQQGRPMSAAMIEALASAHFLEAEITVAADDVGPMLQAAAAADGISFRIVNR